MRKTWMKILPLILISHSAFGVDCSFYDGLLKNIEFLCSQDLRNQCTSERIPDITTAYYNGATWSPNNGSGTISAYYLHATCVAVSCSGKNISFANLVLGGPSRVPYECVKNSPPPTPEPVTPKNPTPQCKAGSVIQTSNQVVG